MDLFPFSGEGRKIPTLLGPLENPLVQWQDNYLRDPTEQVSSPLIWGQKQIQFPKRRVFLYLELRTMGRDQKLSSSKQ
jgi:hypothetical protein